MEKKLDAPRELDHPAAKRLLEFFVAMNKWEKTAASKFRECKDYELTFRAIKPMQFSIYRKYLSQKHWKTERGSFGAPPRYDKNEKIVAVEELTRKKVRIATEQNVVSVYKRRYVLIEADDSWRISHVTWLDVDNRWVSIAI